MSYDSTPDTLDHIGKVQDYINLVGEILSRRANNHDASKLEEPEKSIFDIYTPKLSQMTYGSDEYKAALAGMGEALSHHYRMNSHHPEHYTHGIREMSLLDLIEMLCDWKAATERHGDGDLRGSIKHNIVRFKIDSQLAGILWSTAREMGWL